MGDTGDTFIQKGPGGVQVKGTFIQHEPETKLILSNQVSAQRGLDSELSSWRSLVSASAAEALIADVVKGWIDRLLREASPCFVVQNAESITHQSLEEVESALAAIRFFLLLLGPLSLSSQILHFQAGAAWTRRCPIIVLRHSGLLRKDLPNPYSLFPDANLDDQSDIIMFLDGLGSRLGQPRLHETYPGNLADQISAAKAAVRRS